MLRQTIWTVAVLVSFFGVVGFHSTSALTLEDLRWLLGAWERVSAKSVSVEEWRQLTTKTWEGVSWRVKAGTTDTTIVEKLLLAEMEGEIFYIAKVAENPFPVPFRLTSVSSTEAVFENSSHDFPQRIHYALSADGKLSVVVSSSTGLHADQKIEFEFHKKSP